MNKSETIIELAKALSAFQGEVKQPKKNGRNPHFKSSFATLDDVVKSINETASKHGLSFMQFPVNDGELVGLKTIVMHESGEFIEGETIFARPMKNDPQALGSILSYLKRYSLSAVFGIVSDEDDDSEGAMDRSNQYQPPKQQYQQKQQQAPKQEAPPAKPGMISPAQLKALQVKVKIVAAKEGKEGPATYAEVIEFCGIKPGTSSTALTAQEATKVISYLATLEQQ